jgi:hypothetical protein
MATPGQLVDTMARILGIPMATVTQYDRELSEHGLRSKSGRGRSAAQVTAEDAANLLMAIGGSPVAGPSIKVAAATCMDFGALRDHTTNPRREAFARAGLLTFGGLHPRHTFRDALTALIEAACRGETLDVSRVGEQTGDKALSVTFATGPFPNATISVDGRTLSLPRVEKGTRDGHLTYMPGDQFAPSIPVMAGDLYQQRVVHYSTVRALSELLADGDAADEQKAQKSL